jgi:hypothetical protein
MFGERRHHRHHHHRVVERDLDGVDDQLRGAAAVDVVGVDNVGQEDSIELAASRARSCQYRIVLYSVERSRG